MIVSLIELQSIREKNKEKKIALTGGVFDILHEVHVAGLETIKKNADILVVAICDDKRVKMKKGPSRPINSEMQRAHLMDAIKYVDYVCINPEQEGDEWAHIRIAETLQPDVLVTSHEDYKERWGEHLGQYGTTIEIQELPKTNSTSAIIERILKAHQ